jgi:multidrug efflux pump subunit AcrB
MNSEDKKTNEEISPFIKTFFVKRIVGLLLVCAFCIGGAFAYLSLPKEDSPDLKIPFATIKTEWEGADPESMEKRVTDKIEEKIKSIPRLKKYQSSSFNSWSVITVEFDADANVEECMANLRAEVEQAEDLPNEIKKPIVSKVSVTDTPVLTINLYGDINAQMMNRIAEDLKDLLLTISGVRDININGQRKDEIFILLKNDVIQGLSISPNQIKDKIESAHADTPLEKVESNTFSPLIKVMGRFRSVEDLRNLVIARINDRPIALAEVAYVWRDLAQEKSRIRMSQAGNEFQTAISLDLLRLPGADTLKLVEDARNALKKYSNSSNWPPGLHREITQDESEGIIESLSEVFSNGYQAVILVFIVLFIALSWREGLVAGLSIPLTVLATLVLVWVYGYTLNQMVIVGIVLSLGMLVDVFILMMEGMHENIYIKKMPFPQAAAATVKTYAMAAFTGQLTTIFAFLPLACIGGVDGKFIRIIPIVVSSCLIIAFLIAIFVDIPLSWFVFKSALKKEQKKTRVDKITEEAQEKFTAWLLKVIVRNRISAAICVLTAAAFLVFALFTAGFLQNELYPKNDGRSLGITVELAPDATLEKADKIALALGDILRKKKYFDSVVTYTGKRSPMQPNAATLVSDAYYLVGFACRFCPKKERDNKLAYTYVPELRKEAIEILRKMAPGATIRFYPETGGSSREDPVQVKLIGRDMNELRTLAGRVKNQLETIPGTSDVSDNLGPSEFSVHLLPNREAMDFYQISAKEIGTQLYMAFGLQEIARYPAEDSKEELKMRMGYNWPSRKGKPGGPTDLKEMASIQAFSSNGKPVTAPSLIKATPKQDPLSVTHFNGARTVVVSCQTDNRPAGEIVEDLREKLEKMKTDGKWPENIKYRFGGETESLSETYSGAIFALFIAIFLVLGVLTLQFGNFKQPFIIMTALPLALIGVILGFFLSNIVFSFPAMIGIISLIGIAVNDSIVMIETMNNFKAEGMSVKDAAANGSGQRLRPIIVTTVTTIAGLIPLALSSPMWKPLCSTIIFGLMAATFISLLVVPALYMLFTPEEEN